MDSQFRKNLWRWKCGLSEVESTKPHYLSYEEIEKQQWDAEFERLQKNRMALGFFRYGFMLDNPKKFDEVGSAIKRLQKYQETGNGEFLVDAANLCMISFARKNHDNFHFESIDDGEHVNLKP